MKYTLNKIYILATFILISSFSFAQTKLNEKEVVFGENQNVSLRSEYFEFKKFLPNNNEIEMVNTYINQFLKSEKLNRENYYVQYIGLIRENEKLVFFNASCKKTENFGTKILEVKGGGKCYFSGLYNLNEKKSEKFDFNAPK